MSSHVEVMRLAIVCAFFHLFSPGYGTAHARRDVEELPLHSEQIPQHAVCKSGII